MNLKTIRQNLDCYDYRLPTQKQSARLWLTSKARDYQFAVTLTLKQHPKTFANNQQYYRWLINNNIKATAKRFQQKLNRAVFGNAAKRNKKTLSYAIVIEGERSSKQLHLHMAIGNKPDHIKFNEFPKLVKKAASFCENIDEQKDVQIMDSGWMEYITKEVGRYDTDNVLWELM